MIHDVAIVGGGVLGLSILRSSLLAGHTAVLLERNADLCDGASGRNSGVVCTGVDAAAGTLERALIRDSISAVRGFCEEHNVPTRECGSLVCLWPWDEQGNGGEAADDSAGSSAHPHTDTADEDGSRERLKGVLAESHVAGDCDARFVSPREVSELEPSLSDACRGAVHIPGEIVVDPWLFPVALAAHAREVAAASGAEGDVIRCGVEADMERSTFDPEEGIWTIETKPTEGGDGRGSTIRARCVVNAAGIDADLVQSGASSGGGGGLPGPSFEARPRRGQYAVFAASPDDSPPNGSVPTRPIQPVPSQFTKGIFVYSTLYDQLVVGPTALDQESRTDDAVDPAVRADLVDHASRVMGDRFDPSRLVGEYVGIRPGTDGRDYQIRLHASSNFVTVGGVRSTGLTASLGIGRHVARCLLPCVVEPSGRPPAAGVRPTPLPDVRALAERYREGGDGGVVIRGHWYRVTHPLTRLGWEARTGLAA